MRRTEAQRRLAVSPETFDGENNAARVKIRTNPIDWPANPAVPHLFPMIDDGRDLLILGISAAKDGRRVEARRYLELCLLNDPPTDTRLQAWQYLAEVSDNPAEKRDYLHRVLSADPTDGTARRALAILDGRLNPSDIVNPDRIAFGGPEETPQASAERLACPRCGSGRLVAGPDGRTLTCEHCHYEQPIRHRSDDTAAGQDFFAAMWTAKGHRAPQRTLTFACSTCGASYVLPPDVQSLTCSFCGSVYVEVEAETREVLAPDALLPFATEAADVRRSLEAAATVGRDPRPIYLPVWMFSFAGFVRWTAYEQERNFESRVTPLSGEYRVGDRLVLVCATTELPDSLQHLIDEFEMAALVPYDPQQLAGHLSVAYQISLEDASVPARRKVVTSLRDEVRKELENVSGLEMAFSHVGVDRFKLLLLPFWIAEARPTEARRRIFINGQSGTIGEDARRPGLLSLIARLTGFSNG